MSQYNDIAGSDDVISLNLESQDTLNEHSYRTKQSANRIDKSMHIEDQAKENKIPIEEIHQEATTEMQTDSQRGSVGTINDGVSNDKSASSTDAQNNSFVIQPPVTPSIITDGSNIHSEKDSSQINSLSKTKSDPNTSAHDVSLTTNNLRLYISPSTSLLETTNDDAQPNSINASVTELEVNHQPSELDSKPKDEPMDTTDAQVSLGSDGIIDSHPSATSIVQSTPIAEKSSIIEPPVQSKIIISPASKALYSLSQPATAKFENILTKLATSPGRKVSSAQRTDNESNLTTKEEEELFIRESISKVVRRYAVKIDERGRTISRELLSERTIEENTITRIESWPPEDKKNRHSTSKTNRLKEEATKNSVKPTVTKRKTKSLKLTTVTISPKKSKSAQSDDDAVATKKTNTKDESSSPSDDNDDDDDKSEDNFPTDDVSGDEFMPEPKPSTDQMLTKGLRVFAKWVDGHFYPGVVGNITGEKYLIEFDDGAKRYAKANDIILQSYLEANQNVLAQTQDGYFERGIVKSLIKKKKSGKLGYIVEKDGKQKWYPLRFVSLTYEQAEHLPVGKEHTGVATPIIQGKRKRMSTVPQSPNKKAKSSVSASPNKSQRSNYTPSRPAKLFNTMYFLLTGFNDSMDIRHKIEDSIESHSGKVIEKMPSANRRDNVYLISDMARKTAKFLDAKKSSTPCVNYKWINECIEKGEIQDWEMYKLVLPEKEAKTINDSIDENQKD